tara:strand:+ start:462 stop:968 length:507 start_codon:yes stop_codon:yes gene_type:complete
MDRKEINMLVGVCILMICGLLFYNKKNVNNTVFDFVVICSIIIIGQKYLKVAILLTLLLFILKTNVQPLNEGFELEDKDKDEDTDDDDEDDDDDDDDDEEKKTPDEDEETDNTGTIYESDCKKRCKKSGREEKECEKICNYMCPNPIKYNDDLKQLDKFKKVMEQLNQ